MGFIRSLSKKFVSVRKKNKTKNKKVTKAVRRRRENLDLWNSEMQSATGERSSIKKNRYKNRWI